MGFRRWRQFSWKLLVLFAIVAGALASYQNCGNTGSSSFGSTTGSVNTYLAAQPVPVETMLNQVSYMSCPQAGAAAVQVADPLANPFYRIRFGAFNNSAANGFTYFPNATNVGGIGFSQAAMAYMNAGGHSPNSTMLSNYITSSPFTNSAQPVVAMINQYRSTSSLAWTALATPILAPFSNGVFTSALVGETQVPGSGTVKTGYFPSMDAGSNSLVGSLVYGQTASDEANFRSYLTSQYLFAGIAPASSMDATTITQTLQSPDNDVTQRLFGYGYSFSFVNNEAYFAPNAINEWNLNPTTGVSPVNLTSQNNQQWDCFPLTVVRDIDRKYWTAEILAPYGPTMSIESALKQTTINVTNGWVVYPKDVPAALAQYGQALPDGISNQFGLVANYFQGAADIANVMTTLANEYTSGNETNLLMGYGSNGGTYYACPPEDPTLLDPTVSAGNEINLERLRVVRRFLPAELWEVNISAGCVVPTQTALNSGACYASGDTNQAQYIQYNGTNGSECGGTMNECPARVSFCWRYR